MIEESNAKAAVAGCFYTPLKAIVILYSTAILRPEPIRGTGTLTVNISRLQQDAAAGEQQYVQTERNSASASGYGKSLPFVLSQLLN